MPNDDTTMVLYIYFGCFWLLAHLTGDLSQAEQMHKMATKDLFIMNPKNCIWHYENVSKFEFKAQI